MDCKECNTPMIQGNTYSPFHAVASLAGLGFDVSCFEKDNLEYRLKTSFICRQCYNLHLIHEPNLNKEEE